MVVAAAAEMVASRAMAGVEVVAVSAGGMVVAAAATEGPEAPGVS